MLTQAEAIMGEFLASLSVFGWIMIGVVFLGLWNLRRLFFMRSPLDSPQHKGWRETPGTRPDHLDKEAPPS